MIIAFILHFQYVLNANTEYVRHDVIYLRFYVTFILVITYVRRFLEVVSRKRGRFEFFSGGNNIYLVFSLIKLEEFKVGKMIVECYLRETA